MSLQKGANRRESAYTKLSVSLQKGVNRRESAYTRLSVSLHKGVDKYQCPHRHVLRNVGVHTQRCQCVYKVLASVSSIQKDVNGCQYPCRNVWVPASLPEGDRCN